MLEPLQNLIGPILNSKKKYSEACSNYQTLSFKSSTQCGIKYNLMTKYIKFFKIYQRKVKMINFR